MNNSVLKKFETWTGFVAIITIVMGVLSSITVVGILPGIITIFLGIKLWNAKKAAADISTFTEEETSTAKYINLISELATYFKVQGILILASIALGLLSVILILIFGLAFMPYMF